MIEQPDGMTEMKHKTRLASRAGYSHGALFECHICRHIFDVKLDGGTISDYFGKPKCQQCIDNSHA